MFNNPNINIYKRNNLYIILKNQGEYALNVLKKAKDDLIESQKYSK